MNTNVVPTNTRLDCPVTSLTVIFTLSNAFTGNGYFIQNLCLLLNSWQAIQRQ